MSGVVVFANIKKEVVNFAGFVCQRVPLDNSEGLAPLQNRSGTKKVPASPGGSREASGGTNRDQENL